MDCVQPWWWWYCCWRLSKNRYSSALCATITILPTTQEPHAIEYYTQNSKKKMFSLLSTLNVVYPRRKYKKIFSSWRKIEVTDITVLFLWKFLKIFFFLNKEFIFLGKRVYITAWCLKWIERNFMLDNFALLVCMGTSAFAYLFRMFDYSTGDKTTDDRFTQKLKFSKGSIWPDSSFTE